ncbi:MAG: HNH endonuclease [Actinomycetota bacterium]|nr:HNH endonuclease [Actinomycetota bacterium]
MDRVAAASGHIDALAKAVKRAGDSRPIDHIRAELFLGMTDGTYIGLDDAAIIELFTTAPASKADHPDSDGGDGGDEDNNDRGGPDGDQEAGECGSPASGAPPTPSVRAAAGAGLELRVRLSTLLDRDQYPAELAGWGPVHAELARDLAGTLGSAEWRFAVTDAHGQLTYCGITRARPHGTPTRAVACRALVKLQVPGGELRALAADPTRLGDWAGVAADLLRQLDHDIPGEGWNCADAARRVPGAALRRYLEIRDRYYAMIGCRAPAHTADKDHTVDYARGGATIGTNLGDACRHDHRLKGESGWTLDQPQPGVFRWTNRLGHTYQRRPPAVIEPLPNPIPRYRPPYPLIMPRDDGWEDTSIWEDPPVEPEPDPEPDPPPEPDLRADVPPF